MIRAGKMALVETWIEWCQEDRPMQQARTGYQRIVSEARRLQVAVWHGGAWEC